MRSRAGGGVLTGVKTLCKDRRKDKDNAIFAEKFILDALVEYGALADDRWENIEEIRDKLFIDRKKPRVEVCIEDSKGRVAVGSEETKRP